MEKIGLIAGNRKFPLLFSEAAKKRGYSVVAIAIKKDTSPKLKGLVDKIYWLGLDEFSRMFEIFKAEGVSRVVMAGQISPHRLFSKEVTRDAELKKMLEGIEDKRADTIFGKIAEKLESSGFKLLDSTTFVEDYLPKKGVLTALEPGFSVWEDIYFGLNLAKAVSLLDIGQSVAVKSKTVVAVEAFEGTDNLIRRSGKLARGGITLVKVSKPKQDARFDITVVGLKTIKTLASAGGKCLAIEAGKTLFIDRDESIALAEKKGISIVAI
ncbi:MAG TPA: UDP-2,3-diacylglucosamine diphosphatase LpxI [Candidatus Margulisiibacteriota bacterium]|nr:UDP-2,3-diacylglucosamine diphosphatase LpxI [Candidatus Margulisiibacteriota bacterium]